MTKEEIDFPVSQDGRKFPNENCVWNMIGAYV